MRSQLWNTDVVHSGTDRSLLSILEHQASPFMRRL
jgi:hypothetical protein